MAFFPFLIAFYVLAGGLSILETNANPYVLALGPEESATRRLNLAQAFNPVGSILGTLMAQILILAKLEAIDVSTTGNELQGQQIAIVVAPYLIIGVILIIVWILIARTRMPYVVESDRNIHFWPTVKRLVRVPNYIFALVAQFFYVGAQITVWTFTLFYVPDQLGFSGSETLQYFHLPALLLFGVFRFVSTAIMGRLAPHRLLAFMAIVATFLTGAVIVIGGWVGCIALVGISACMSLMFPTIFGLGSRGLGEDAKLGGSGLIMAIVGGAILTPLQGFLIDVTTIPFSFVVPFICFIVVSAYALFAGRAELPHQKLEVVVP